MFLQIDIKKYQVKLNYRRIPNMVAKTNLKTERSVVQKNTTSPPTESLGIRNKNYTRTETDSTHSRGKEAVTNKPLRNLYDGYKCHEEAIRCERACEISLSYICEFNPLCRVTLLKEGYKSCKHYCFKFGL